MRAHLNAIEVGCHPGRFPSVGSIRKFDLLGDHPPPCFGSQRDSKPRSGWGAIPSQTRGITPGAPPVTPSKLHPARFFLKTARGLRAGACPEPSHRLQGLFRQNPYRRAWR